MKKRKIYQCCFKRLFDITISLFILLIMIIPMIIIAILIKIDSRGPVLFKQERLGKGGQVFRILKFRSMYQNVEHTGSGVYSGKNDSRVTHIGKFIRATSIDELPQLLNILRGDMSIIGPRPPLTYHPWTFNEYTEKQKKMFDVCPGITGWAQTHGRKEVEWEKRIELNIWYVNNISFILDLKIFFLTIFKVATNKDNINTKKTASIHTLDEKTENNADNIF